MDAGGSGVQGIGMTVLGVEVLQHGADSYIMITWYVGQARLFSFQPT